MEQATILIVDDEAPIREMLRVSLEIAGYQCLDAKNAYEAQIAVADQSPNLILLDWMMPEVSGLELLRRWRRKEETKSIPIIMLTAKAEEDNTVAGLNSGADDYIRKPFSPRELIARINTLLRRTESDDSESQLSAGNLIMDTVSHSVALNGQTLPIGPTEYRLLEFFLKHQNRAYTREQLLNNVWGSDVYIDERTVDVHILRLRKELAVDDYDHCIQTVRGFGYRFSLETPAQPLN